ncbi:unnamed protein product [Caenorhabditis auriculariae]|uniref:Uncharacterized protein n=1 Tax=Caenorhabditis auriculariae TaxID=2777116 RepID=A0A8S1GU96_9PELO|nr:unnamed protein product [Caenorhabditis auriculariae]
MAMTWVSMPDVQHVKKFFRKIIYEEDVDYDQFESKIDGSDIVTFRENDKAFRLFGTNVHVKIGSYIACGIGFIITLLFCISYTFFHTRGLGRNPFIDHLELVDLVYAFVIGLPCHVLLFLGLKQEKKMYFSPFLVFYVTNFILNCVFTALTLIAFAMDIHQKIFGNVRFDLGWTVFQIVFTAAQGLAIYVVMRGRKYVAAKDHWKRKSNERHGSVVADGVTFDGQTHENVV